jgi:hypothetical protein
MRYGVLLRTPFAEWCSSLIHALHKLGVWERADLAPASTGQPVFLYTRRADPIASRIPMVFSVHPPPAGRRFPWRRGQKSGHISHEDVLRPVFACTENLFACPQYHDPCSYLVNIRAGLKPTPICTWFFRVRNGGTLTNIAEKPHGSCSPESLPRRANSRGLCRIDTGPVCSTCSDECPGELLLGPGIHLVILDHLITRMSSMNSIPVPSATGAFRLPTPMNIFLTLVILTPAKSLSGI